LKGIWKNRN